MPEHQKPEGQDTGHPSKKPVAVNVARQFQAIAIKDVIQWAQATLSALNVGDVQSESPIHKKLRKVMIAYRASLLQ